METKETAARPQNGSGTPVPDDEADVEARSAARPKGRFSGNVRPFLIGAGLIVALLVLVWGVRFLMYAVTHQSTDDAYVEADLVTVTSKISERVDSIYTDTNRYVHKGDLLIQLDDRDERTRYAQALAAYRAEQATANAARSNLSYTAEQVTAQTEQGQGGVSAAQSGVTNAQEELRVAQAAVPAARQALAKANADNARTATLVATGDLAKSELDSTQAAQKQAQAQYQQALDRVAAAESAVGVSIGQLTTAQGKLAENQLPQRVEVQAAQTKAAGAQAHSLAAQLRTAADQLSYTKIYAPISGYIGQRSVDLGQQVAPGTTLLMIVPNDVYVTANFKETQMGKIQTGEDADVSVDAYPGVRFYGKVATISPASQNTFALVPAQNATGNFVKVTQRIPVRIYVTGASKPLDQVPLRPGMSVVASVRVR